MTEPRWHLAQVNIGRVRGGMNDPIMAGFVARLKDINALADRSQFHAALDALGRSLVSERMERDDAWPAT
ncbi:MAG TPA: DUF3291 domain-containing protein [Gemmatimonadales bacterium]